MKIVEYKVLVSNSIDFLESDITKNLADGWQPFGSIITKDFGVPTLIQPMVKYEEPQPYPVLPKPRPNPTPTGNKKYGTGA